MIRSAFAVGLTAGFLLIGGGGSAPQAAAQSILKRLEEEVRQRVAEGRSIPPRDESPEEQKSGYLGAVVDDRQDRGRGVRVLEVRPDGPASVAGLRSGDLITGVAGVRVRQTEDLADVMSVFPPGSRVAFDVLRQGQTQKLDVVLGRRDAPLEGDPPASPEVVPLPLPEPMADPIEPPEAPDTSAEQPAAPQDLPAAPPLPPEPDTPPATSQAGKRQIPEDDSDEVGRLRARIAELERRVEQLERALADSLKPR